MIGIYCFINKINDKRYIGQSIQLQERIYSDHKNDHLNEKNGCYNTKFYQALRKYGFDNFEIVILEECQKSELNEKEKYWINYYDSFKNGYNSTPGGNSVNYEILFSEEIKQKRLNTLNENKSLQGENHPRAKLTDKEVYNIRQRYIDGETVDQIWQDYKNIYNSKEVFKKIVIGETYKYVGNMPKSRHCQTGKLSLSKDQILEIRRIFDNKEMSITELSKKYKKAYNTIYDIVHRKSYKHIK